MRGPGFLDEGTCRVTRHCKTKEAGRGRARMFMSLWPLARRSRRLRASGRQSCASGASLPSHAARAPDPDRGAVHQRAGMISRRVRTPPRRTACDSSPPRHQLRPKVVDLDLAVAVDEKRDRFREFELRPPFTAMNRCPSSSNTTFMAAPGFGLPFGYRAVSTMVEFLNSDVSNFAAASA